MAKGEDTVRKKKNRLIRKKLRKDTKVSTKVAAIIASKQRRKNGKRRMCEGMCFSLPTPEDPYNDRSSEKTLKKKKTGKRDLPQAVAGTSHTKQGAAPEKDVSVRDSPMEEIEHIDPKKDSFTNGKHRKRELVTSEDQKIPIEYVKTKVEMQGKVGADLIEKRGSNLRDVPHFIKLCLSVMEKALEDDGVPVVDECKPHLFDTWGVELLKWEEREPLLETTGACFSMGQMAWMVSNAASTFTYREREGISIEIPFLLILVATKEKAVQVRSLCKPLKAFGIHTVSLHSGSSLDHQIRGLQSCAPDFLVSTPERLLELVSMKAIDISCLCYLVVDGLESFANCGSLDTLTSIRKAINKDPIAEEPRTIICFDSVGTHNISAMQNIVSGPIRRLSLNESIASQGALITQHVHFCNLEERAPKAISILNEQCMMRIGFGSSLVLFVEGTSSKANSLAGNLRSEGYTNLNTDYSKCPDQFSSEATVTDLDHVWNLEGMQWFHLVFILKFPPSIDDYVRILTTMGRDSCNAELHCFFGPEDAPLAGPLINILNQCGQNVPESLSNYSKSSRSGN